MYQIALLILISFFCASSAQANVYEYLDDGAIIKHEAYDYRSPEGSRRFDTVVPVIERAAPTVAYYPSLPSTLELSQIIENAASRYNLNSDLIRAVIQQESAGNELAISPKGAQGLMQLMPATAKQYGAHDPFDPEQNINAGSKYLSYLFNRYDGDTNLALAAYNAGEGTVDRYGGVPPYAETKAYVRKISSVLENSD